METENPNAHYDHASQKWIMWLAEKVEGDTQEEAEAKAEERVAFYHRAVEESEKVLAEGA